MLIKSTVPAFFAAPREWSVLVLEGILVAVPEHLVHDAVVRSKFRDPAPKVVRRCRSLRVRNWGCRCRFLPPEFAREG